MRPEGASQEPGVQGDFQALVDIITYLRSPQGCPWDRDQTHSSLRKYMLEECYEVLDCLDKGEIPHLKEELGDILLQVLLHAQLAGEEGLFDVRDVLITLRSKLIQRHPHVFGDVKLTTAKEVEEHWEEFKGADTDRGQQPSLLSGVPRVMPALAYSQEIQSRAASTGFDWEDVQGVMAKVQEELKELEDSANPSERENELGDVFLALVNVGRKMEIDVEGAVRKANQRFYRRFQRMEQLARAKGAALASLSMEEKNALWEQAKLLEG